MENDFKSRNESFGFEFNPSSKSEVFHTISKSVFELIRTYSKNFLNLVRCKSVYNQSD